MATSTPTRREMIQAFVPQSPLPAHLGIVVESLGQDEATLVLPFRQEVVTIGDVVHGGAIGTLADTAAMAASWATDDPVGDDPSGATVSLHVDFLAAARAADVRAHARVLRRGGRTCFVRVDLDAGDTLVATASAVYQLGR